MSGITVPSSRTNFPPAFKMNLWWRLNSACLDVVGVSLAAPSAFLSGENSSSLSTSHTAKSLSHFWGEGKERTEKEQTTTAPSAKRASSVLNYKYVRAKSKIINQLICESCKI